MASSRAGGCTADHYVRRHILHGQCSADVVWIDEVGQIDASIWVQLNKLTKMSVRWLLSGDFEQFAPMFSSFRGCPVPEDAFQRSNLLHILAGGNRLTLRDCRRSEAELFSWYSSLVAGGRRFCTPLADVVAEARRAFTFQGPAQHNLVISHRKRVALNAQLNKLYKTSDSLFLRAAAVKGQLNAAQAMWVWAGIELLGCCQAEKREFATAYCTLSKPGTTSA